MAHMERPIRGHVKAVTSRSLGDELSQDETAGANTLHLSDVRDFLEEGGQLFIDDTDVYDYTAVDFDLNTVYVPAGTDFDYEAGISVLLYPEVVERRASVSLDETNEDDDDLDVRVPHALWLYLPEGVRTP